MLRFFIFFLCIPFLGLSQQLDSAIQQSIVSFSASTGLENAAISFEAYNLSTNQPLAVLNENMALPPASNTKLFTTAGALELLGKNYRPKTLFYTDGKIDSSGVLHGDIIIRGLGDPTLGSKYFTDEDTKYTFLSKWVKKIKAAGITKIDGRIIADGSAFGYHGVPDGWTWSDMGNYYGAGPSGCAVFDNMAHLHFSTSYEIGGPTTVDSITPNLPHYVLHNHVKSSARRGDHSYVYGAPYSYQHFATGTLPRGRGNFEVKVSVPDPELLLSVVFTEALEKDSIPVQFPAEGWRLIGGIKDSSINYATKKLLFSYKGETVQSIIDETNQWSVNFFAEQLLCLIGYKESKDGSTENSVKILNNYWEQKLGIPMEQTDGCGLSRSNAFSANHFIRLLKFMYHSNNFKSFEASLPIAGKSGTLTGVCNNEVADGRMHAKSGTLHHVKAYSGYIHSKNGTVIAFSFIVNNHRLSNHQIINRMENVFNAMAAY